MTMFDLVCKKYEDDVRALKGKQRKFFLELIKNKPEEVVARIQSVLTDVCTLLILEHSIPSIVCNVDHWSREILEHLKKVFAEELDKIPVTPP